LPSFDDSEPIARLKPLTMLPITPCVCVFPTVFREGPPRFSRFLLLALFFWYRFAIAGILSGIDPRVNGFCRGYESVVRYGLSICETPLVCSLTTRQQCRLCVQPSVCEPVALGPFCFRVAQGLEREGPASK